MAILRLFDGLRGRESEWHKQLQWILQLEDARGFLGRRAEGYRERQK